MHVGPENKNHEHFGSNHVSNVCFLSNHFAVWQPTLFFLVSGDVLKVLTAVLQNHPGGFATWHVAAILLGQSAAWHIEVFT